MWYFVALNVDTLNRAVAVATASTDNQLQQHATESRDRFQMLDFLRRITLDVTNSLTLGVRIDDGSNCFQVQFMKIIFVRLLSIAVTLM